MINANKGSNDVKGSSQGARECNPRRWPIDESETLAHHLWESLAWHDYLAGLTVRKVREHDTNFHRWLRPLLADLPDDFAPERVWQAASRVARRTALRADAVAYRWHRAARRAASDSLQFLTIARR